MLRVALITAKRKDPAYLFQTSAIDLSIISIETYLSKNLDGVETLVTEEMNDLIEFKPDLVGISSTTETYTLAVKMAEEIKRRCGSVIVIGGTHITTCPGSIDRSFDIGVMGEGEITFLELVKYFRDGKRSGLEDIRGIVCRDNGEIKIGKRRPEIKDLTLLPIPDRRKWVDNIATAYLMTSRGCPYKCYFCSSCRQWQKMRFFPVDYVIREVKDIADAFSPKCIRFFDDVFTLKKDRVKEITSKLISEGLTKDISYICWTRANLMDEEYAKMLKDANFINVGFGIESASKRMMKKLKGGGLSPGIIQRAVDILYDSGIKVTCTFIIGTPGETSKDLDETYEFIERNKKKLISVEVNPIMPYPSTPLWKYASGRGLVSTDMDWERLSDTGVMFTFDYDNYIYLNEDMPRDEFMRYVEKFIVIYKEVNTKPETAQFAEDTFPISVFPAKLKRAP